MKAGGKVIDAIAFADTFVVALLRGATAAGLPAGVDPILGTRTQVQSRQT